MQHKQCGFISNIERIISGLARLRERSAAIQHGRSQVAAKFLDCRARQRPPRSDAFTLIELSIVLVIIGLIVGGVLVAQDLIKAAKYRALTSQHQSFKTAINTFKLKYNCLPGDCINATTFFGFAHASANTCRTTISGTTATCNGNGDRRIISSVGYGNEIFRFWHHLTSAGFLPGDFTGVQGSGGVVHSQIGVNVPASPINNTGWSAGWLANGSGTMFVRPMGNYFQLGGETSANITFGNIFTPLDAWKIDSKIDDGMPGTGEVGARIYANCTDASNATDFSGPYNIDNPNLHCTIIFINQF